MQVQYVRDMPIYKIEVTGEELAEILSVIDAHLGALPEHVERFLDRGQEILR